MIQKLKIIILSLVILNITAVSILNQTRTEYNQISNAKILGVNNNIPEFDPSFVISDYSFSTDRVFPSEQSIQEYLDKVNSPLKSYTDAGKLASYWIFNSARGVTSSKYNVKPNLNPALILTMLEKEQSLLSIKSYDTTKDPERRIKSAMGYGCPDDAKCNPEYAGLANQLNWSAYQLQYNYQLATKSTQSDDYQLGKTITTLDKYNVKLNNAATSSLYRYTPHVYWGNYSVWKIMTAYGWGQSSATYNINEIDRVNLAKKTTPVVSQTTNEPKIGTLEITPTVAVNCKNLYSQTYQGLEVSQRVRDLQVCLKQDGKFAYPEITGKYGPITQAGHQMVNPSLTIGSPEVREITLPKQAPLPVREITIPKQSPKPIDQCQSLKNYNFIFGSTNDKNKQLQDCMTKDGIYKWKYGSTGYFGDTTRSAFEKWKRL